MAIIGRDDNPLHSDRWNPGQLIQRLRDLGLPHLGGQLSRKSMETIPNLQEVWVRFAAGPHHRKDEVNRIQVSCIPVGGGIPVTRFANIVHYRGEGLTMEADYQGGFRVHHYDFRPIWCMIDSTGQLYVFTEGTR